MVKVLCRVWYLDCCLSSSWQSPSGGLLQQGTNRFSHAVKKIQRFHINMTALVIKTVVCMSNCLYWQTPVKSECNAWFLTACQASLHQITELIRNWACMLALACRKSVMSLDLTTKYQINDGLWSVRQHWRMGAWAVIIVCTSLDGMSALCRLKHAAVPYTLPCAVGCQCAEQLTQHRAR